MVHDAGGGEAVWGCCEESDSEHESESESETRYAEPVEGGAVYWASAEVEMAGGGGGEWEGVLRWGEGGSHVC